MKYKFNFNLKLTLLLIMFLGISLSTLAFINFNNVRQRLIKNRIEQLQIASELKANDIEYFFRDLTRQIHIVQDYYNIKTNLPIVAQHYKDITSQEYMKSADMLDNQLKTMVLERDFYDLLLLDKQGKVVYTVNKYRNDMTMGQRLLDPSGRAFEEGKKDVYFSEIFSNRTSEIPYSMLVTAPITDFNHDFIGVVALEIDMDPVYQLIKNSRGLGNTGEILVGRDEGDHALFLHNLKYDPDAAFKRKVKYSDKFALPIREAVKGIEGAGLTYDYRPEPIIASWRPIDIGDKVLGLVVKMDRSEALSSIQELKKGFIAVFLVTMLSAIIVIFVNAKVFTEPILKLRDAANAVAEGDFTVEVPQVNIHDEIGDLTQVFNKMVRDLNQSTVSRDQLVSEIEDRKEAQSKLEQTNKILEDFNDVAVGREERMIELKKIINDLSQELGRPAPYNLDFIPEDKE